jgi:hypothetical protein
MLMEFKGYRYLCDDEDCNEIRKLNFKNVFDEPHEFESILANTPFGKVFMVFDNNLSPYYEFVSPYINGKSLGHISRLDFTIQVDDCNYIDLSDSNSFGSFKHDLDISEGNAEIKASKIGLKMLREYRNSNPWSKTKFALLTALFKNYTYVIKIPANSYNHIVEYETFGEFKNGHNYIYIVRSMNVVKDLDLCTDKYELYQRIPLIKDFVPQNIKFPTYS